MGDTQPLPGARHGAGAEQERGGRPALRRGDLAALRMGVRVDREGLLRKDFQTAQNVIVAGGGSVGDLVSNRYFLSDAAFLVGLEGDFMLLHRLHASLAHPRWPVFLGRKSYVPSIPPYIKNGLLEGAELMSALASFTPLISVEELAARRKRVESGRRVERTRFVLESASPTHEIRRDQPMSFALGQRVFHDRFVVTEYLDVFRWTGKGGQ
ncbi:conserved hypothetical protein [Syntrophobacter fumaroxidans MPOB]|uniref:Uncharacterized protein n=1 Tax=Syntrophobacter fumaroxidans (strain DSM 10017 / MPOB) TaxID=335543 RepID=A0LM54_SYNFM|nr:conserved hypothetical protein [Syntrophobacter fumaroxidans MPOB]